MQSGQKEIHNGSTNTAPERAPETFRTPTVIIGAGPAGLAVGACLKRANRTAIILEKNGRVGSSWSRYYERLRLNTDKHYSALPYLPFPQACPQYPSRLEVLTYLENYARHFDLNPRLNERVLAARHRDGFWETRTPKAVYVSDNLVVASGNNQQAARPRWPGQDDFAGTILHSIDYKTGRPFKGRKVLVVGIGNSGGEIALDLYEQGAHPSICVRGPVNILPRDWLGIPVLKTVDRLAQIPMAFSDYLRSVLFNRFCYNLPRFGLVRPPFDPITQINRLGKLPLIDNGTIPLIKKGFIKIYPGIVCFTSDGVRFEDGRVAEFDVVLLATGFYPRVDDFLSANPGLLDRHGRPRTKGCKTNVPGLYFCGFTVSPGGILKAIGQEARVICQCISESRPGAVHEKPG